MYVHFFCTVYQAMNSIYGQGLFLLQRGQARSILYPGHIRLGNRPHMLDNGPLLTSWNVLSLGTLCPLGRFVRGMFVPWFVLSVGCFVLERFVLGHFVCASIQIFSILSLLCLKLKSRFNCGSRVNILPPRQGSMQYLVYTLALSVIMLIQ